MAATDLGKVGIVTKGDWSSSVTYEALDAVAYNNETYIAKQAVPANTLPTNTTYWQPALTISVQNGTLTSPKSIFGASLQKTGHVIVLYLEVYPINTLESEEVIGILPSGFYPTRRLIKQLTVFKSNGADVAGHAQILIATDGKISLKQMPDLLADGTGFVAFSETWIN